MKKRKSAAMLVGDSVVQPRATWFSKLGPIDRTYVREVVAEMKTIPDVAPYLVAGAIKAELSLPTSHNTIAITLKEMMNGTP